MRYVIFNRKGGVGKSTIVTNLAAVSASLGRKTLIVDLDPQGNTTQYLLGRSAAEARPTLADFFEESLSFRLTSTKPAAWVHATPFTDLFLISADERLAELEPKLESRHKIYKLRDLLRSLADYEVFIDTPPAFNFFTTSALIAAERCLIPFDCDDFSRRAIYQLLGMVREIRNDHNEALEIGGVIVNQFQERARLPRQLVEELRREGLPVLEPFLTTSVKVRESHQHHKPLIELAPTHKVSEQFRGLYDQLIDREASTSGGDP